MKIFCLGHPLVIRKYATLNWKTYLFQLWKKSSKFKAEIQSQSLKRSFMQQNALTLNFNFEISTLTLNFEFEFGKMFMQLILLWTLTLNLNFENFYFDFEYFCATDFTLTLNFEFIHFQSQSGLCNSTQGRANSIICWNSTKKISKQ